MINAVVVEDEKVAREVLINYITKYCPSIQIVAEAEDCNSAINTINSHKPELVFLDVEMPYGNAFDVLDACNHLQFQTIFTTAYADYAIKALNMAAAFYLLKPIDIDELILAVQKVETDLSKQQKFNRNQILIDNFLTKKEEKSQLVLPTMTGYDIVPMGEVIRLQANGNFTDLYLKDGSKKMVCRFLKHFISLLSSRFIRVHRSHIINLDEIASYHKGSGGCVVMNDGSEVDISLSYKNDFLKSLKEL